MLHNITRKAAIHLSAEECMELLGQQVNDNPEFEFHSLRKYWPSFHFYRRKKQNEFLLSATFRSKAGFNIGVRGLFRIKGQIFVKESFSTVFCKMSPPALYYVLLPFMGILIDFLFYGSMEITVVWFIVGVVIAFANFQIAYRIFKELDKVLASIEHTKK